MAGPPGQTAWTTADEGYLRAYQWAAALAAGTPLPGVTARVPLGPGEVAHADLAGMALSGFFGEQSSYSRSFLLFGGPVGLALTGAASLAHNAAKKAEAERAAVPRWHDLGRADVTVTSQRLVALARGKTESLWYAEAGTPQWAAAAGAEPAVQLQPPGMPLLRLQSPWAGLLYVFAHAAAEGRPPGVPVPDGLLDRARAQGRLQG
jgi:hypothetical protein